MNGMMIFLGVMFSVLAVWVILEFSTGGRKTGAAPRPAPRAARPAQAGDDPWGMGQMRTRERDSVHPGQRLLP